MELHKAKGKTQFFWKIERLYSLPKEKQDEKEYEKQDEKQDEQQKEKKSVVCHHKERKTR